MKFISHAKLPFDVHYGQELGLESRFMLDLVLIAMLFLDLKMNEIGGGLGGLDCGV